jgi:hypothetical protein
MSRSKSNRSNYRLQSDLGHCNTVLRDFKSVNRQPRRRDMPSKASRKRLTRVRRFAPQPATAFAEDPPYFRGQGRM